jgi:negative regulator of sigma E activity
MTNEELDSQLSAMFDDELPEPECELLARRLARDENLKARWGRYAAIGAAIRQERGVRLQGRLAARVSAAVSAEPTPRSASAGVDRSRGAHLSWLEPVAGAAVAAGVAVVAVLWMRAQSPQAVLSAATSVHPAMLQTTAAPDSYVVPPAVSTQPVIVPPAQLANYVVAHSEFSTPLIRPSLLSALVTAESNAPAVPVPAPRTKTDKDR